MRCFLCLLLELIVGYLDGHLSLTMNFSFYRYLYSHRLFVLLSKVSNNLIFCLISIMSIWSCNLPNHHNPPYSTKILILGRFLLFLSCFLSQYNIYMEQMLILEIIFSQLHLISIFLLKILYNIFLLTPNTFLYL
jgi:hypothetical protein